MYDLRFLRLSIDYSSMINAFTAELETLLSSGPRLGEIDSSLLLLLVGDRQSGDLRIVGSSNSKSS